MEEAIKNFNTQFSFEPKIENQNALRSCKNFAVVGMGGSGLGARLIKDLLPELDIIIHKDYGLPRESEERLKDRLIILSSYSGNTEEVIDAFRQAQKKGCALAVIAVGGKILELAKESGIPYIELPNTGIQPRSALGFSVRALLKFMNQDAALAETRKLVDTLSPVSFEVKGKDLAEKIKGRVPVIYASTKNSAVAYNWKIKLNETGKIPAFYNLLPELNHNEMNAFDPADKTRPMLANFHFIFLADPSYDARILKRMDVLEKLYTERGLPVERVQMSGEDPWQKVFSSLLIADWFALHTALLYDLEPEQVPMVEYFKKLLS